MKKLRGVFDIRIYSILICLGFSGCFAVSKKSKIAASEKYMDDEIKKVFILVDVPSNPPVKTFERELQEQLEERNISCNSYKKKELDLTSDKDISDMIRNYRASHVINIYVTSRVSEDDRTKTTFKISLLNVLTGEVVWQGYLNQDTGVIKKSNQSENDAKLIIDELDKVGLFK